MTNDPKYGSKLFNDNALVSGHLLQPPSLLVGGGHTLALPALSPPYSPAATATIPFGLLRGGSFSVDALWIIDDFGQWLDLLGGSVDSPSVGIVVSPHSRWPGDPKRIAQPPRVLQPARLSFRLVDGDFRGKDDARRVGDPVCGWILHNYLDQALTLCDAEGNLLGELVLVEDQTGLSVRWECLQEGRRANAGIGIITNLTLRAFANALIDLKPKPQQKLQALLALIDDALGTIRPGTSNNRLRLAGRPLALVNARVGLDLFGRAWTDPQSGPPTGQSASGDPNLDALQLPVRLGNAPLVEDGLIGYYRRTGSDADMGRIVAVRTPDRFKDTTDYLGDASARKDDAVRVGFGRSDPSGLRGKGRWQFLTLLMDPHGSVHASVGILPPKSLSLPKVHLDRARENMEFCFRVAPLLLRDMPAAGDNPTPDVAGTMKMPIHLPAGSEGRWTFKGPQADQKPLDALPPDTEATYGSSHPLALEGRLVLRKEKGADKTQATSPADTRST